ncbi:MAG TPA: hypothetical protein VGB56_09770 [Flavisolibacter sp.]|jgi:hypothetical protein
MGTKLRSIFILLGKLVFSICFLLLFIQRVGNHQTNLIQFSLIDFIYDNRMGWLYYILAAAEISLVFLVFLTAKKIARTIADIFLVFYTSFMAAYLLASYSKTKECFDCNYTPGFMGEHLRITIAVLGFLFLSYFLFLRNISTKHRKEKLSTPNSS